MGPDLPNNMFGSLMSFKEKPRAVSVDLEGIFVLIGIEEDGQNFYNSCGRVMKELSSISISVYSSELKARPQ